MLVTMSLSNKCGYFILVLLLVCTGLIPYSHCSADEVALHYGESCGSDCTAKHGFSARHEPGHELHEHTPDNADSQHFHFILEGINSASRSRFDQDVVKTVDNSATVEALSLPDACFVVRRAIAPLLFVLHPQIQTIPTGLSPPC